MTSIHREIIDHPSAWTAQSLGGKAGLVQALTDVQLDAIDELLAKTRHRRPQEVTRAEFDHPALTPLLAELFDLLQNGRGAVVITGVTPQRYSREDFERIYWGFGTHWGIAVTQSAKGDRLGHVMFTPVGPDNPTGRAYRSNEELSLHTDTNEIVGLMSLEKAPVGGYSQLASAIAIHNEIVATRPDLLEPLYEGFYYTSREHASSGTGVTPFKVPVFSFVAGKLSCLYTREFIEGAAARLAVPLPSDLVEAMDYFNSVADREDVRVHFVLEPGEMMVFNNFTTLHARTTFQDSETQKRHLLRLWLDVPQGRPVSPEYQRKAAQYRTATDPVKEVQLLGAQ